MYQRVHIFAKLKHIPTVLSPDKLKVLVVRGEESRERERIQGLWDNYHLWLHRLM